MKQSIYPKKAFRGLLFILLINVVICVHSVRTIYRLQFVDISFYLLLFMLFVLVVGVISVLRLFEQLTECIEITDDEIILYVMFHKERYIKWSEVKEIGIGQIYTPVGIKFCVYFSRAPLSYEEIDNLDLACTNCLYLRILTAENYEKICKHCSKEESMVIAKWLR